MEDWIYDVTPDNKYRFILGQPRAFMDRQEPDAGPKLLICFGINPSTAEPGNLDNTLRSVVRIARNNGYDGWAMCNIYPQRATDPDDMDMQRDHMMHSRNLAAIGQLLRQYPKADLWAAWGTLIMKRDYLHMSLMDIDNAVKQEAPDKQWITFGDLSKDGHPHHPLYLKQDAGWSVFSPVPTYIEHIKQYTENRRK